MSEDKLKRLLRLWIYIINPIAIFLAYKVYGMDCLFEDNEYACIREQESYAIISFFLLFSPIIFLLGYCIFEIVWVGRMPQKDSLKYIFNNAKLFIKNNKISILIPFIIVLALLFNI